MLASFVSFNPFLLKLAVQVLLLLWLASQCILRPAWNGVRCLTNMTQHGQCAKRIDCGLKRHGAAIGLSHCGSLRLHCCCFLWTYQRGPSTSPQSITRSSLLAIISESFNLTPRTFAVLTSLSLSLSLLSSSSSLLLLLLLSDVNLLQTTVGLVVKTPWQHRLYMSILYKASKWGVPHCTSIHKFNKPQERDRQPVEPQQGASPLRAITVTLMSSGSQMQPVQESQEELDILLAIILNATCWCWCSWCNSPHGHHPDGKHSQNGRW